MSLQGVVRDLNASLLIYINNHWEGHASALTSHFTLESELENCIASKVISWFGCLSFKESSQNGKETSIYTNLKKRMAMHFNIFFSKHSLTLFSPNHHSPTSHLSHLLISPHPRSFSYHPLFSPHPFILFPPSFNIFTISFSPQTLSWSLPTLLLSFQPFIFFPPSLFFP